MKTEPFYRHLLKREWGSRVDKNPRYSLRSFARALNLDPSALSQIMSGQRLLSEKMAERIFLALDSSAQERSRFLRSLAETKQDLKLKRISPALKQALKNDGPEEPPPRELTADLFKTVADWHHYAILILIETEGFRNDARWIASQLDISPAEAALALDRLQALEFIREENGKLIKAETKIDTKNKTITAAPLKRRQMQILEKSMDALQNVPIEFRNHSAVTIAIDPDQMPLAKKRIQKFLWDLADELMAGKKRKVYELTVNLFPLQKLKATKI